MLMSTVDPNHSGQMVLDSEGNLDGFRPIYRSIKPKLEFILSLVFLGMAAPVMALIMILVRLGSSGRSIYSQTRLGFGGREFSIYKIRTMYQDCEQRSGIMWSMPGDSRVTRIGRQLRWCHLDELPQLVNVLKGDLSLVGPRPERAEIAAQIERALPEFRRRLEVKPGLTGLAQVMQPPDIDLGSVRSKLQYDLYYIDHLSFWLDLRILLATVFHIAGCSAEFIAALFGFPLFASSQDVEAKPDLSSDESVAEASLPAIQKSLCGSLVVPAQVGGGAAEWTVS
jgi:lipopolysaccharide/colanic/teichoic acid biosynthesis glycosyltransferase